MEIYKKSPLEIQTFNNETNRLKRLAFAKIYGEKTPGVLKEYYIFTLKISLIFGRKWNTSFQMKPTVTHGCGHITWGCFIALYRSEFLGSACAQPIFT